MKKKIGVLTYWGSQDNYGQILQCYAFQKYLHIQGYEAFLIKYRPADKISFWKKICKKVLQNMSLKRIRYYFSEERKKNLEIIRQERELEDVAKKCSEKCEFDRFREESIVSTDRIYYTVEDLITNPPDADVYVCGSDQVWHDSYSDDNTAGWFLQFGNAKRVSYAASAGREISNPHELAVMKKYLDTFQAVSVREESLKKVCDGIGCPAEVVLDPTLLLDYSDYSNLITNEARKPYIFIYILNGYYVS